MLTFSKRASLPLKSSFAVLASGVITEDIKNIIIIPMQQIPPIAATFLALLHELKSSLILIL